MTINLRNEFSYKKFTQTMAHYFKKTLVFVLYLSVVTSSPDGDIGFSFNEFDSPCYGRTDDGFVRDLSSCQRYVYCENGQANSGICDPDYVFDAESELCVSEDMADTVCFRCPENIDYELISVPHICKQYIQCFHGNPTLKACPSGLVFDGRAGIHQCNQEPSPTQCYREDLADIEHRTCPPVYNELIYYVEPDNQSMYAQVFFVMI